MSNSTCYLCCYCLCQFLEMCRQLFHALEDRFGVTTHAHHLLIGLLGALSIVLLSVLLREVCEELLSLLLSHQLHGVEELVQQLLLWTFFHGGPFRATWCETNRLIGLFSLLRLSLVSGTAISGFPHMYCAFFRDVVFLCT